MNDEPKFYDLVPGDLILDSCNMIAFVIELRPYDARCKNLRENNVTVILRMLGSDPCRVYNVYPGAGDRLSTYGWRLMCR